MLLLLRRMETYGFKSFADKTELEFDPGVTAIVGPNGSGKSNISDAIRWALGEQSIRTLRGSKAEDIIFAGSSKRRALGTAEVSLIFDNTDNLLPVDFAEVVITRRIFRSGDSEFYINKAACRLKDIHELLADTGLGRDSMSVIGQNKIDEVLNSKPEERRSFFEEAAGITKYKNRKREAQRKMEETSANLDRVRDLMTEIESQLEPMAASAERTRQFRVLQTELTAVQATLLLNRLSKAMMVMDDARQELTDLTDREIAAATQVAADEAEKEQTAGALIAIESDLTVAEADLMEANTTLERLEGKKAVLHERIRQSNRSCERLQSEQEDLAGGLDELNRSLTAAKAAAAAAADQYLAASAELEELTHTYDKAAAAAELLITQIENGKEQSFAQLQELTDVRNALRTTERDTQRLQSLRTGLEKEQNQFEEQLSAIEAAKRQTQRELEELSDRVMRFDEALQTIQAQKQDNTYRQQVADREEQNIAARLQENKSRLGIMVNMQNDYEGFSRGVKELLKNSSSWRSGICGAVAELFTVPEEYVVAVETALGGALQHIVVEDEATAKQGIGFLKNGHLGRATFLPLTTVRPGILRDRDRQAAQATGAVGMASQLVSCDARFHGVRDFLLGRTIVVRDIDAALRIAREHNFSLRIVTLDGQQIHPGGSMTGGSIQRRESSFLSRHNEIASLKQSIRELEEERQSAHQLSDELRRQQQDLAERIDKLRAEQKDCQIRQAELAVNLERNGSDRQRALQSLQTLQHEVTENSAEEAALTVQASILRDKISALETHEVTAKEQVRGWQYELTRLQAEKESCSQRITDRKVASATLEQNLLSLRVQCGQSEQQLVQLRQKTAKQEEEMTAALTEIAASNEEIHSLEEQKGACDAVRETVQQKRQALYEKKMAILTALQKLERRIRDGRRRHHDTQTRLHETQLMMTKYQLEKNYCEEQLATMALDVEQAAALKRPGSQEELAREAQKWEEEIVALGPVNPAAIEEYERLADRYAFLRRQSDDLAAARDSLLTVIRDMDATMSRQFGQAFAAINEKFSDIFARLFGGGHAELELLNPDDALESGIDISVQPPGKKKQNLSLLSGGERALTVIALLFSFLAYRPAPFCVLDEIDAALDEANVQRFSDFLQDYAKKTQFILVTHRKGTMEAADIMLGVTMEESGVSRLLSVKFMDKAV